MMMKLNTFQLKVIALICMVIDHIAAFIPGTPIWFRYIGRLSAPIFLFCLVWGMEYTRNRTKYILRLLGAAIGMEIFWVVIHRVFDFHTYSNHNNIFLTFFCVGVLIELFFPREWKLKKIQKILILVLISGAIVYSEWGLFGCVLGVLLYKFKNDPKTLACAYIGCCAYYELVSVTAFYARLAYFTIYHLGVIGELFKALCVIMTGEIYAFTPMVLHGLYWGDFQWMMIGALPFMLMYDGKAGRKCKWFFYIFYPLHLFILMWIAKCVAGFSNVSF